MSVRAYKLIEIKTEKDFTFNCSHNSEIYDLGSGEGDILQFDKDDIEAKIAELLNTNINDKIGDNQQKDKIKILQRILKEMGDEEYVEYYCF